MKLYHDYSIAICWFNFILGSNFIFRSSKLLSYHTIPKRIWTKDKTKQEHINVHNFQILECALFCVLSGEEDYNSNHV